jgi:hypothetical protein
MIVLYTTVLTDYLGANVTPHTDWLDRKLNQQRLGLTDLILREILQGIRTAFETHLGLRVIHP